ncbi:hypothetical protein HHL22_18435 [Hymenobacter sp. RP-2-7]|uniref:Lipoprotein n=1 Tax=Hymenobacter polaris TaxID=2682546 RepID=A0A7Y0AHB8_9BACT|nr:hypothetical protein [Hymenobacter polaris]NML67187.1 hypothetical protein [Hymenobacter polaris]
MKKLLPLLLPAAVLALASCSSEPSDWRPDKKVSIDLIPPGTRPSDNFDQGTDQAPSPDKGGAIPRPLNSGVRPDHVENPTPAQVMSADTQEGTAETKVEQDASKRQRGQDMAPSEQAGATRNNREETQGGASSSQKN